MTVEMLMTVERRKMSSSEQWRESWQKENNKLRDQNTRSKKSQSRQDTPRWPHETVVTLRAAGLVQRRTSPQILFLRMQN